MHSGSPKATDSPGLYELTDADLEQVSAGKSSAPYSPSRSRRPPNPIRRGPGGGRGGRGGGGGGGGGG